MARAKQDPLVERLNLIPITAGMTLAWGSPMLLFWLQAWGPLRPYSYTGPDAAPTFLGFFCWLGVSFLPCLLPASYYRTKAFEAAGRLYERLGVRLFRHLAPNGDLINGYVRRRNPAYRVVWGRTGLREHVRGAVFGEQAHTVMLLTGVFTSVYALRIGWNGWAALLTLGNMTANLYPILLQRYTRAWIARIENPEHEAALTRSA